MEENRNGRSNKDPLKRILREGVYNLLKLASLVALGWAAIMDYQAIGCLTRGGATTFGLNVWCIFLLSTVAGAVVFCKRLKNVKERWVERLWDFVNGAAVVMILFVLWRLACCFCHWDFRSIVNGSQVMVASLFANDIGWRGHLSKFLSAINISFNLLLVILIVTWYAYTLRTGLWRRWFVRWKAEISRENDK